MTVTDFAKDSPIPKRILRYLHRKGFIQDPLSLEDQISLNFLGRIWGRKEVVRSQIAKLSMKNRLSFLRTADLPSKWERYAYSRFRNQEQGKKLAMEIIVEEIEISFKFRLNKQQKMSLYKIRNRAQVARHRDKSLPEIQEKVSYRAQTNNK